MNWPVTAPLRITCHGSVAGALPDARARVHRLAVDVEGRRSALDRERDVMPAVAQLRDRSAVVNVVPPDPVRDLPAAVVGQDPAAPGRAVAHQRDPGLPEEPAFERTRVGQRQAAVAGLHLVVDAVEAHGRVGVEAQSTVRPE